MKTLRFLLTLLMICFFAACTKDIPIDNLKQAPADGNKEIKSKPEQLKIAVISDIHFMDPSLLIADGSAFQTYLAFDPKLLQFSAPIFMTAISKIQREKPDIVLIPGDLTKDGEKVSHEAVAAILHQLTNNGIKVYVIPGNHDINNPEATIYDGDNKNPAPTIQKNDFSSIYGGFGYNDALYRDANSLSYICQPYKNLWILGIDDCKYEYNTDLAIVSGVIKPGTMTWILEKLQEAKEKNITVLSMMHHGIAEHYIGEQTLDFGYVTDNYTKDGPMLLAAGLKVMFTGHYHANDITMLSGENGDALYDIETGSLVTPPSPFRIITLSDNGMDIRTNRITSINCTLPLGFSFTKYSDQFLKAHMDGYFAYVLQYLFGVPAEYVSSMAPLFRNGWMAHYAGDEKITPPEQKLDNLLGDPMLMGALQSIWTDLPPADNQLHIYFK